VKPLSAPSAFARFLRFLAGLAKSVKARKETLWTLYLEDFLLSGRVKGKGSTTLRWYRETLTPFVAYLDREGLGQSSLRKYLNALFDHLKIATVDTHVRAIKAFLRFL